jgi:hypothetical protein
MNLRPSFVALLISAAGTVQAAETPVSIVASACPSIPASRLVDVMTTTTLGLGQDIVLALAVDSADAPDLVVSGPAGVAWSTLGGHKSETRNRAVLLLRGRATQAVASASAIRLNFGLVDAGRSVCVRGLRYAQFLTGPLALSTDGQAMGTAAVANPTVTGKRVVDIGGAGIAAFAFGANPNAITTTTPDTVFDGGACNTALDLCLRVAHRGGIVDAGSIGLTPTDASDWSATLAVMAAPQLFKDGFE